MTVTVTLLLDLDDTLLDNPLHAFLSAYTRALAAHMAGLVQPDLFVDRLLAATRRMVANQDPDCLLSDVFDAAFYPSIGVDKEIARPAIDRFYAEVFPSLKSLTRPRPGAIEMVDKALQRGYRLVIATNPLFPLTAIQQRLSWGGFTPDGTPFALVPAYDRVHFAKPNPSYLAELLALLGWPASPAVMVGNDLQSDIRCAQDLGLATYLVTDKDDGSSPDSTRHASGRLENLLDWIETTPPEALAPDYTGPSAMLAILRSTPAALKSLSHQLPPDAWNVRIKPGEWCQTEMFCHLRDVEAEVNYPRLQKVANESNPFIPGQDTDPWAEERQYIRQDGHAALAHFTNTRKRLIDLLSGLSPSDWQRPIRHAIFGPTHLDELVSIIAGHDRLHVQQVYANIAAHSQHPTRKSSYN